MEVVITGEDEKAFKVAVIGPGKLTLGYVVPLFGHRASEAVLLMKDSDSDKNKWLYENHSYRHSVIGADGGESEQKEIRLGGVRTYNDVKDTAFWDDIELIVVSVGMKNLASVAEHVSEGLRCRRASTPIMLVAFENGERPSRALYDEILNRYAAIEMDGYVAPCNAAVDSMCDYQMLEGGLCATGQENSSAVVIVPGKEQAEMLGSYFVRGTDSGLTVLCEEDDSNASKKMQLFERKKAWLVNAPDYIVAAESLNHNEYTMPSFFLEGDDADQPEWIKQLRQVVQSYGSMARSALKHLCGFYGIDEEEIIGEDSFLGSCEERVELTLRQISAERVNGRTGRSCFKVLSSLGAHNAIRRHYFNANEFDGGSEEDAIQKSLLKLAGGQYTLNDIFTEFYRETSVSSYFEKIRQRLIVAPMPLTDESGGQFAVDKQNWDGMVDDFMRDVGPDSLVTQLNVFSSQLKVAATETGQGL